MSTNRYKSIAIILSVFMVIISLAVTGSPVRASIITTDGFPPGTWSGTFVFNFDHTFNAPAEGQSVNYYSLQSRLVVGSLRFVIAQSGATPQGIVVRFPPIPYDAVAEMLVSYESECRGYVAYGGGFARMSSHPLGAPLMTNTITTAPILITSGNPFGELTPIGNCDEVPEYIFQLSMEADLAAMAASPWTFQTVGPIDDMAVGTCTTEAWEVPDHSLECSWQVFRKR